MDNEVTSKKYELFSVIYKVLWGISIAVVVLFLCNSYFVKHYWSLDPEDFTFLRVVYFLEALNFGHYFSDGGYGKFLFIIIDALMILVLLGLLASISTKLKFLKSNNKLSNSICYLICSLSALILGIIIYVRGSLVGYEEILIYSDELGNHFSLIYYLKRCFEPILYGIFFVIMDIPCLILGIKEYKKNKNKLSIKEKISKFFDSPINCLFLCIFIITSLLFIYLCFNQHLYVLEDVSVVYFR